LEFNKKLQQLRKQKNLTQEELAKILFVSRVAISKWESGRGYPSIESLKAISKTFDVTIDNLLSNEELILIAEDKEEKISSRRNLLYGLLDMMSLLFMFMPLFGQKNGAFFESVSLLNLTFIEPYMLKTYIAIILIAFIYGIIEVILQNFQNRIWKKYAPIISLILTIIATVIFMISQQPYMGFFMFWLLILKGFIYLKER